MALRLRRGTDAERLTITPLEGELIYTTDLKELWIGDGTTVGGNKIGGIIPQFLNDLTDVDANSPQIGQVLKWDGSSWIASADTGVIAGENYNINILGIDSAVIVDSATNTFTGNFNGDFQGDITGSLFNNQNTKIVDANTNTFTGNFVGDGSGLTNLPIAPDGSGVIEGSNYRINVVSSDSTVIVDSSTSTFTGNFIGNFQGNITGSLFNSQNNAIVDIVTDTFTGNFVGDGSGLTNLNIDITETISIFDLTDVFAFTAPNAGDLLTFDGANFVPQRLTQIVGSDSSIILDANTNTFTGNFVGNGSGLTDLPSISIFDLSDVFSFTPPDADDILTFDGSNFVPRKIRRIFGADSSIMLDTFTNTFTGVFVGDGSGLTNTGVIEGSNYRINIVADDSTLLVNTSTNEITGTFVVNNEIVIDGITGDLNVDTIRARNSLIQIVSDTLNETNQLKLISNNNRSIISLCRISDEVILDDTNTPYGSVFFNRIDDTTNVETPTSIIAGFNDKIILTADSASIYPETGYVTIYEGGFVGIGTQLPTERLDVKGNGKFDGTVTAASFNGSLVSDDSTTIVDATNGTITASGYIQFGTYTTTARDALVATNGIVIYNSTANRFQGFQNGAWINLDDGSVA